MRIKDHFAEGEEGFNLVPLTDMVFNLLIFFMCATTFAQVEKDLNVKLPEATASFRPLSAPPQQLIVNVHEDGSAWLAGRAYDLPALTEQVQAAVKRDANVSVIIRADERAIVRHFAAVAGVCRQAGVQEARLSYLDTPSASSGKAD
jgi:biopolymer transport protein ExbD